MYYHFWYKNVLPYLFNFSQSSQRYAVIYNINSILVLFLKPSSGAIYYHVWNTLDEMLQRKC